MTRTPLIIGGATIALALTLGLAGCTASSGSSPRSADQADQSRGGSSQSDSRADSGGVNAATPADVDRAKITTGTVTLTVDDPAEAATKAGELVAAVDGRVDARDEQAASADGPASASLTLRIPADDLDATRTKLEKLGHVESVSITSDDVTTLVRDTDARITALQASVDRLTALLAKADTTSDLVALENALSARQAELESLQAQKRGLDDQVALSTITLELNSPAAAPTPKPQSFLDGLAVGWAAFLAFWAGLLVVLGALTPWIVALAVIGLVVLLVVRRRRRALLLSPPRG
ncbi:DUF4349 domain-containing protein [Schumannella sp. 10F1B-5-1]|uniref:DUF4349 domain-containing protein n=1 Tax=Schumannella sp. 10F1B-5-1 TaxID=2590780 RepID=UPI0011317EC4|nr:DUF4349 domain-containing protein [Schumannella sp. 10F1B-5-1]TPW72967.1 DUF4349 domain-containing protein [Schumannella sp. 10F1B-5-1]